MRDIHQGDLFIYLNDERYLNQNQVTVVIKLKKELSVIKTTKQTYLSEIKKRTRKGIGELSGRQEEFYKVFFSEIVNDWNETRKKAELDKAKSFVQERGVMFPDFKGRPDDTYESYVLRMLEYGLSNYEKDSTAEKRDTKTKTAPESHRSATATVQPSLKNRNFYEITDFIGRERLLEEMEDRLQNYHTVILSGVGGIGKTQLAKKYASRHSGEYGRVQFVYAGENTISFRQMILALKFDGLDEKEKSKEDDRLKLRMELLQQTENALLIFDNVDRLPEDMDVYNRLLETSSLHIIITTRLTETAEDAFHPGAVLKTDALTYDEQLKLFALHYGEISESDIGIVKGILEHIHGHTLLIELIAKSCDTGEIEFTEMLEELKSPDGDDGMPDVVVKKDGQITQESLWSFVRRLYHINQLKPEQQTILRYLALLPVDGISRSLFMNLSKDRGTVTDLENKGLAIKEGRTTRLHPVIRDVVLYELKPDCTSCAPFIDRLCDDLPTNSASVDAKKADEYYRLLISATNTPTMNFEADPDIRRFDWLMKMAEFCKEHYHYQAALDMSLKAQALQNELQGQIPDERAYELYSRIGELHRRVADYPNAILAFEQALTFTVSGSKEQAVCCRNIGEVYRKKSDYPKALEYYQKAKELFTDDAEIAGVINDFGVVYVNLGSAEPDPEKKRGHYQNALQCYQEAIDLWTKCGAPTKKLTYPNHNIGTVYYNLGDYQKAAEHHEHGLRLREECDADPLEKAMTYIWLGNDYIKLKRFETAKDYIDKGLNIRREYLGENHPDYAWALTTLSEWYEATGDLETAMMTMQTVCDIRVSVLGKDHQYTIQAEKRMAELANKKE